jgi:sugar phosphate isomerase/epimerase
MKRDITLFSGQFADLSIRDFAQKVSDWGYDGVELACWGEHVNVPRVLREPAYAREIRRTLDDAGLGLTTISSHLVSQAVGDRVDERHHRLLPESIWGDGDPEGVRLRAEERMKDTARAAAALGVETVVGFTGSSIFHMFNGWPPISPAEIDRGYEDFAERWSRIMKVFETHGVRYALEVMPGQIGYDISTMHRALDAIGGHPSFGINFDPSHFHWQFLDNVAFVREFGDRIYNVHIKDAKRSLNGRRSILGSHLPSGHPDRAWDFVSVGHGEIPFEAIIRALNDVGYVGPLAVEWEDSVMDREVGAAESVEYLRRLSFDEPSATWFSSFATPE